MKDLEKYELVNKAETIEDLEKAILAISDDGGIIQGRTKKFDAIKMAANVRKVVAQEIIPNVLTREYGIRQQALYLMFYV